MNFSNDKPEITLKVGMLHAQLLSRVQLFATPWTVACQAPLSMGFSRQNTAVGCHFLLRGIFLTHESDPQIKPASPALAGRFFTTEPHRKPESRKAVIKSSFIFISAIKKE